MLQYGNCCHGVLSARSTICCVDEDAVWSVHRFLEIDGIFDFRSMRAGTSQFRVDEYVQLITLLYDVPYVDNMVSKKFVRPSISQVLS